MRSFFTSVPELLLRVGVAFSFLYPPVDAWFDPYSWIGFFPPFVASWPIDAHLILHLFGLIEIALAVWILSGWKVRIPATIAGVLLLAIVAFNMPQFQVVFRDVSIALAAFALALWPRTTHASDHP